MKQLLVRNGQFVEAGQSLASISQNRNLFIKAEIQPRYYRSLSNIRGANFRLLNEDAVYSLQELGGRLVSFGKSVDADSPLIPVVFSINNTIDLLPVSFVEMYIKTSSKQPALTVPNVSLVEEMDNYFVYVQLTPEYFEKREVKIGKTDAHGMTAESTHKIPTVDKYLPVASKSLQNTSGINKFSLLIPLIINCLAFARTVNIHLR